MTAEDLARWCHALFEGEVVSQQTRGKMLRFVDIGFLMKQRGYGLGLELFLRKIGSGETAIGYSGAIIGSSANMVHLPEHHVSVVVMLNSFDHKGSFAITKELITCVLKDLGVRGLIPFIAPFLWKDFLVSAPIFLMLNIVMRKREKAKIDRSNEGSFGRPL